eukprot:jgi/Mesvir1/9670/Mv12155-RA.1
MTTIAQGILQSLQITAGATAGLKTRRPRQARPGSAPHRTARANALHYPSSFLGTPVRAAAAAVAQAVSTVPCTRDKRRQSQWACIRTCASATVETGTVRIHYHRDDAAYDGWGVHVWSDVAQPTSWDRAQPPSGKTEYGVYFDVGVLPGGKRVEFLIHRGEHKDNGGAIEVGSSHEVWVISESAKVWSSLPDLSNLPKGDISKAKAIWVDRHTIAWAVPAAHLGDSFRLVYSGSAALNLTGKGVEGADSSVELKLDDHGLPPSALRKFPHLAGYQALTVPKGVNYGAILTSQVAVCSISADGKPSDATAVQLPGVLDDLYPYDGALGCEISGRSVTMRVWAPTAQSVRLHLFNSPTGGEAIKVLDMRTLPDAPGVWSVSGPSDWVGKYYKYEVKVFCPWTGKVEVSMATDPYSRGLSANGERTYICDLTNKSLCPPDWATLSSRKPAMGGPLDITLYELHVRDFSAFDKTVPEKYRGGFMAFTEKESSGMKHLAALAKAGLTHIHLLPAFDFATVNERKNAWKTPDYARLASLPPDSSEQQDAVFAVKDVDSYNWGYDPVHYGVPDGSYATDPDGGARIKEFRAMVKGLNEIGIRVVMDVVYNHQSSSGPQSPFSVFDKIVPGYYLRRNPEGFIENSTAVNNTACEHYMFSRFIVDDLVHWARDYKVDGFRFDLMGHLMLTTMQEAKRRLQALTLEADGVDGSKIYLYGEGWDFGEVARNRVGVNASQLNLAGTGIGSFNDRIREACNGGNPFGNPLEQGFLTGLHLVPNELEQGDTLRKLMYQTDFIRLGMAGNLKDVVLTNCDGMEVMGGKLRYNESSPCAYADQPDETVNYVSAHDNETLFDTVMLKVAPSVSLADRCRINRLGTSIIAFSQGIPFFHAGDEVLRSKSLDRDSYNSGDWFNKLDWTYESNNFGVGLPGKEKNGEKWDIMRPLLANASLRPSKVDILASVEHMKEVLAIRRSSVLFRLPRKEQVLSRVKFLNVGASATPGVIVMQILDGEKGTPGLSELCPRFRRIVVVVNARPDTYTATFPTLAQAELSLHPLQAKSKDEVVRTSSCTNGSISVPARTCAVFVHRRQAGEMEDETQAQETPQKEPAKKKPFFGWFSL